jgi:hypothetical protein
MTTIVIMPGGFHPFHAGHAALYQSAQQTFPDADVYVAATNDTSSRPFPFAVKEKLARLAGVETGHFVQVKSPFKAEEITAKFDPQKDVLIFVRSEKDSTKPPQPGGIKKDGSPAYLQPLLGAKKLEPFAKHAYMAYLPTVEFGPGMTSATEIRSAWPTLNEKRKTALVMSLYPKTQTNPKLAQTVVKLLDTALGVVDESALDNLPRPNKRNQFKSLHKQRKERGLDEQGMAEGNDDIWGPQGNFAGDIKIDVGTASMKKIQAGDTVKYFGETAQVIELDPDKNYARISANGKTLNVRLSDLKQLGRGVGENQGWAATFTNEDDYIEEKWSSKYKNSINCAAPRGFSQRAHCAGRKK